MQSPATSVEGLTDDLFGFLTWLFKSADAELFRVAAELDLSLSQLRALHVLDHAEHELALTELAPAISLSVAATGRAVDVLCRHDLVSRHEDPVDRRIKRLALTAAGRDKIARMKAARLAGLRQFVDSLSGEERERFHQALGPVLARPDVHSFLQELPR